MKFETKIIWLSKWTFCGLKAQWFNCSAIMDTCHQLVSWGTPHSAKHKGESDSEWVTSGGGEIWIYWGQIFSGQQPGSFPTNGALRLSMTARHEHTSEMAATVASAQWVRFAGWNYSRINASQEVQFWVEWGLHSKNPQRKCVHERRE